MSLSDVFMYMVDQAEKAIKMGLSVLAYLCGSAFL